MNLLWKWRNYGQNCISWFRLWFLAYVENRHVSRRLERHVPNALERHVSVGLERHVSVGLERDVPYALNRHVCISSLIYLGCNAV